MYIEFDICIRNVRKKYVEIKIKCSDIFNMD